MARPSKPVVPVFFGCDQRFTPFMGVALLSLIDHASSRRRYAIHILHTDINQETQDKYKAFAKPNISIEFHDVSETIDVIIDQLPIRDYYSPSTYFRFVIAANFPQYDKALYIDCDTTIMADVAKLYDVPIGNNLVAAVPEAVVALMEPGALYVEQVLGVNRRRYFNAGMLVINSEQWRKNDVLGQFINLVSFYNFVVAQDQDYLNVICKNKVHYLPRKWNMETLRPWNIPQKDISIIHYAFSAKPWHDINCFYGQHFWKYASMTPDYMVIKAQFASITNEQLEAEKNIAPSVMTSCMAEVARSDNFLRRISTKRYSKSLGGKNPVIQELIERIVSTQA